MKKLLYSLMTLAAALTVTSCLKEVEGGSAAYDDGTLVDATFAVTLGPQTKAFADGTSATNLYAGLYEINNKDTPSSFIHVAHTASPIAINTEKNKFQVSFPASLKRTRSYAVVFWAQAPAATAHYSIDWAAGKDVTTGPFITVATGSDASPVAANDETRDAFTGIYKFGPVTDNVEVGEDAAIPLTRPFAQINILVPDTNVDVKLDALADGERTSSMTITGLPNKLNLATGAASGSVPYVFGAAKMKEDSFVTDYQYMAMNYVLPGTEATYPVTFSVTNKAQVAANKTVSVPVARNTRTNIKGNIFAENFNFNGWTELNPTVSGEQDADYREINITVGGAAVGTSSVNVAVEGSTVIQLAFEGAVSGTITATSSDESVATATVNQETKQVTVTGGHEAGNCVITVLIPGGTKSDTYAAREIKIPVQVGTPAQKMLESIAISDYTTDYTVGGTFAFDGTVTATYSDQTTDDVTASATVSAAPDMSAAANDVPFTISYTEGGVTKTADGAINVAAKDPEPTEYTVTVTQPTHGTISLKNGNTAITLDGEGKATVEPDTEVTVSYAADDYAVEEWSISSATLSDGKFTMPSANVTISATIRAKEWKLVTDDSTLSSGDKITFGIYGLKVSDKYYYHTIGAFQSDNYYNIVDAGEESFASSGSKLSSLPTGTNTFSLGGNATDGWTIYDNVTNKYVTPPSKAENKCYNSDDAYNWTISITNNVAAIVGPTFSSKVYKFQWNANATALRFTCYGSTQKDIMIFRYE